MKLSPSGDTCYFILPCFIVFFSWWHFKHPLEYVFLVKGVSPVTRARYFKTCTNICFSRRTSLGLTFSQHRLWQTMQPLPPWQMFEGEVHVQMVQTGTYPYFSASSRASSSLTALWSVRSHLLPHRMMSGFSQYAWICNWPAAHIHVYHCVDLKVLLIDKNENLVSTLQEPDTKSFSAHTNNRKRSVIKYPVCMCLS